MQIRVGLELAEVARGVGARAPRKVLILGQCIKKARAKWCKPCPSFPWSFRKIPRKTSKISRIFSPYEPLKTLENTEKKAPKDQENSQKKKHQGNKNFKEEKDREVQGAERAHTIRSRPGKPSQRKGPFL